MESDKKEKVAQLQFSESRKKGRAEMLGNDIRHTGAKLYQQARYHVGAQRKNHIAQSLAEGVPLQPRIEKIEKENKRNER